MGLSSALAIAMSGLTANQAALSIVSGNIANANTLGYVVQAACLAHDIGNPPFGHFGEHAIQSWFKKNTEPGSRLAVRLEDTGHEDFTLFDGNVQGFRVITQLEDAKWTGGLQLTHAVLGTFTKYPRAIRRREENTGSI